MKEIWKDIQGYEGLYQVSNMGEVRSVDRVIKIKNYNRKLKGKLLLNGYSVGYKSVNLSMKNIHKTYKVHILVAKAFISNPLKKRTVNHKDLDKLNNNVENLEWNTDKENNVHSWKNGRKRTENQKQHAIKIGISTRKEVLQIDKKTKKVIKKYESIKNASNKLGISQGNISNCCRGKVLTAGGYQWQYANKGVDYEQRK